MQRIDVAERRRRLAVRHGLAPRHRVAGAPADPAQVARRLVALHGTDPATVYLSVQARMADQSRSPPLGWIAIAEDLRAGRPHNRPASSGDPHHLAGMV